MFIGALREKRKMDGEEVQGKIVFSVWNRSQINSLFSGVAYPYPKNCDFYCFYYQISTKSRNL